MKRILIIAFTLLLAANLSAKQDNDKTLHISGLTLRQDSSRVTVSFRARAEKGAVRRDYTLTVIPTISGGSLKAEFTPIVIRGKRAQTAYERNLKASGERPDDSVYSISGGGEVDYSATIPYHPWMENSDLVLDGVIEGCCSAERTDLGLIASNLMVPGQIEVVEEILVPRPSVGDSLAMDNPFIQPINDFILADKSHSFIENNRDGSITVFFKQGLSDIFPDYRKNNESLRKLLSAINALQAAEDSEIVYLIIAGYASPEGTRDLNSKLARNRAEKVKRYIIEKTGIDEKVIDIYNGREDWTGLRKMVEGSEMPYREETIRILTEVPVRESASDPQDRLNQLKKLGNGVPYGYMYENFFPELRNATYIRVYYQNK